MKFWLLALQRMAGTVMLLVSVLVSVGFDSQCGAVRGSAIPGSGKQLVSIGLLRFAAESRSSVRDGAEWRNIDSAFSGRKLVGVRVPASAPCSSADRL